MQRSRLGITSNMKKRAMVLFGIVALGISASAAYLLLSYSTSVDRQEMIHMNGMSVMPFDLDKTQHVFKKTDTGGTQDVVVKSLSDTANLAMIRMHLKMEAENFAKGDYSDPAGLHGEDMPGIKVLERSYSKMNVKYSEIENGARVDFSSTDSEAVAGLHMWFDAQMSDHGKDASVQ